MIYRCPNCNGALEYNPLSDKMECAYCGNDYFVWELENTAVEPSYDSVDLKGDVNESVDFTKQRTIYDEPELMECKIYTCTSCGAELAVNDTEVSTYCAYCGQPTIVYNRVSKEQKPKYIIPFKITKEQVVNAIREKFGKGIFTPNAVKNFEVDKIRGIYIPYYLFDVYYHDCEKMYVKEGVGDNAKTVNYIVEAECEFKQISCDASKKLSDESTQRLEPYDLRMLRKFEAAYMSGFYADRYDLSARQLTSVMKGRCKELYDSQIKRVVRDDNAYIYQSKPDFKVLKAEYALLPVWFMTFRYHNNPYTILVNGQTGKVVGAVPFSKLKFATMYLSIAIPMCILVTMAILGLYHSLGDDIKVFSIVLIIALALHLLGLSFISTYNKNMKLTKLNVTAKFVKERQDEE